MHAKGRRRREAQAPRSEVLELRGPIDCSVTSVQSRFVRSRRAAGVARAVVRGLFADHAFDHAATMAFYFFLGAIPLLVVLGLLVGTVVQQQGAEALAGPLLRSLPRVAADRVREELDAVTRADARAVAPLSIIGFIWLTTNGVHNLMDVLEQLLGAPPRRWWRQRGIAALWVIGGMAALGAATWIILALDSAAVGARAASGVPSLLRRVNALLADSWQRAGVLVVFVGASTAALAAFYRTAIVRSRNVRPRVWPGAFVAIATWALVSWVFAAYVATIADYAVYYGGLAAIAVILLWLYLSSLALLVGAEVNAHLERGPESSAGIDTGPSVPALVPERQHADVAAVT